MAKAAEDLLIGTGWLPEPLRTPGQTFAPGIESASSADAEVEAQSRLRCCSYRFSDALRPAATSVTTGGKIGWVADLENYFGSL